MTHRPHTRRLTVLVTIVLSIGVLIAALLGPAQTLAQTRTVACSTAASNAKAKRASHTCAQPSHKHKGKARHKRHGKRTGTKKTSKTGASDVPAAVLAQCEDGSAPVASGADGFSCSDGSEPGCEDGATPTTSRNGKALICPVFSEGETISGETECEEEGLDCSVEAGEPACETSDGASVVCETEG